MEKTQQVRNINDLIENEKVVSAKQHPVAWREMGLVQTVEGRAIILTPGRCLLCGSVTHVLAPAKARWREWESDPGDLYGTFDVSGNLRSSPLSGMRSAVFLLPEEHGYEGEKAVLACYGCASNDGEKYRLLQKQAVSLSVWKKAAE